MKLFLGFVLISGVGWLLDIISYAILLQITGMKSEYANFISSMVGVTYVWFNSLSKLFDRRDYGRSHYLPIYWGYQGTSILSYSILISIVATSGFNSKISEFFGIPLSIFAKVIITIPNLLTNFIFMSILTKFMKRDTRQK
jgi:putative flippase GtrA